MRGLGRSPSNPEYDVKGRLDSLCTTKSCNDIEAIEIGMSGVDAVICAYSPTPGLLLDGQPILLRAAERKRVTVSMACTVI